MNAIPQVRTATLIGLAELCQTLGLDPYAILRDVGINPAHLHDPENWISAGPVVEVFEVIAQRSGCDHVGMLVAESRTFASLGPLVLLLKHLPDAKSVVEALIEYRRHVSDVFVIELNLDERVATIRCNFLGEYAKPQFVAWTLGMGCRVVSESVGGLWRPDCVHFTIGAPADLGPYRRFFQCDLEFDSDFDGYSCATERLALYNPNADEAFARHARTLLKLSPAELRGTSITDTTSHTICRNIHEGRVSLEETAKSMGIAPRKLQRDLQVAGTTYGDLLDQVRRDLAQKYLAICSHSITDVAVLVGYSSLSAFTRWFAEAFGATPTAWRNRMRSFDGA